MENKETKLVNIKDVAGILKVSDISDLTKKAEELELPSIEEMEENIKASQWIEAKEFTKKEKEKIASLRKPMKNNRIAVEKFAKLFKDYLNETKNKVIATEKIIVEKLKNEEQRLQEQEKIIDEHFEKEERKALLPLKKEKLKEIEMEMTDEEILNFSEEEFGEFFANEKIKYLEKKEEERIEKERVEKENFINSRKAQMQEKLWEVFEEAIELSNEEFVDFILNKKLEIEEEKRKVEEEKQRQEKIQGRKNEMLRVLWEIFEDKLEISEEDFSKFISEKTLEIEKKKQEELEKAKAEAEEKAKKEAELKAKLEVERIEKEKEEAERKHKEELERIEREKKEAEEKKKAEEERLKKEEAEKQAKLEKEKKYQDFLKKNEGNFDKIVKEDWKIVLYKKIDEFII